MAILTVFNMPSMDVEKYMQGVKDLEAAGLGTPKGRTYHVAALQQDGGVMVTDVWDSPEDLDEFGKTLIPVLKKTGVTPVEPKVYPVANVIKG